MFFFLSAHVGFPPARFSIMKLVFQSAQAIAQEEGGEGGDSPGGGDPCYEGGGGPPTENGTGEGCCPNDRCCNGAPPECCHNPDPCCAPDDPCCGNPDRCCNPDNPCCESPDPCCNINDPCCGNSDRCCNDDNPCCGSADPCCDSSDPCCGNSDRCCNDDNPCCGSPDPCCNSSDPCCGNPDRCCNADNPCCGSPDPCCNPDDPCCGNPDPCCNPDNPCCGLDCHDEDPCTNDFCDPMTGECVFEDKDCDDDDPCTEDSCDPETGECLHECADEGGGIGLETCAQEVKLLEITFVNDHQVFAEADPGNWGAGEPLAPPDWRWTNNPDNPVSYKRARRIAITARIEATYTSENWADLRVEVFPFNVSGSTPFPLQCGKKELTVSLLTDGDLPDEVRCHGDGCISDRILCNWSVKWPGSSQFSPIASTQHDLYVTYDTPIEEKPTRRRLALTCRSANHARNQDECALGIWRRLTDVSPPSFSSGRGSPTLPWELMLRDQFGDCRQLSKLMKSCCNLLGVDGSLGFCYATTDHNNYSTSPDAYETRLFQFDEGLPPRREELRFYTFDGWNRWQAVFTVNGHHYAVKETHDTDPVAIIMNIVCPNLPDGAYQGWRFKIEDEWQINTENQFPAPFPRACP